MEETCLLSMRCPVYRRRDSNPGFCSELETLVGDDKGKGASGETMRPKVPMRCPGADCSIVALNRGNARGAKGAGHPRWDPFWVNGQPEELTGLDGRRQPSTGGTSRISRETYVRICERLGVRFPGSTRRPQHGSWHPTTRTLDWSTYPLKPHQVAASAPTPYRSTTPANGCLASEERD